MSQRGERLLVCLPSQVFGGHERMLVRILTALSDRIPAPIVVVCADIPELLAELGKAPRIAVRIGYGTERRRMDKLHSVISTFRAVTSTGGRMVLLAPGSVHTARHHLLAAKLAGRKVAAYVPLCFPASVLGFKGLTDWITRVMRGTVDLWITITGAQQELLKSHFGIRKPIQVVPNVAMAGDAATVAAPARGDGRLQVVFLGRYDPYHKGLDWLCRALQESHEKWAGRICFQFFGDGEFRGELDKLAARCAPGDIIVKGWTESSTALAGADLLLLPSRYEGFPLVFIEAAKAGVPILSTAFFGARELLGQGAWVSFGDTHSLVSSLLRMTEETLRRDVAAVQKASLEALTKPRMFDLAVEELAQRLIVALKAPAGS
jgi:glycosyltransferase involved in cell wall biosynthesis